MDLILYIEAGDLSVSLLASVVAQWRYKNKICILTVLLLGLTAVYIVVLALPSGLLIRFIIYLPFYCVPFLLYVYSDSNRGLVIGNHLVYQLTYKHGGFLDG